VQVTGEIARRCGDRLTILSGDDFANLGLLAMGATGAISVTANVAPRDMAALFAAWDRGDVAEARRLHYGLLPLHEAMFLESNPIPVKTALGLMGRIDPALRPPLCELGEAARPRLKAALAGHGLIRERVA
jgi:4-hydroxy-tetrahydrodipicolinate synthase